MNDYIRWCQCSRRILTTEQMRENKLCEICQKEHASDFHKQFDLKKEEQNVKNSN